VRYTVKAKLATAFGLVVTLSMAMGGLAFFGIQSLGQQIDSVVNTQAKKLDLAQELKTNVLSDIRAEKNMILATSDEDTAKWANETQVRRDKIHSLSDEFYAIASPQGKFILDKFNTAFATEQEVQARVRELALTNAQIHRIEFIKSVGTPAQAQALESLDQLLDQLQTGEPNADRQALLVNLSRLGNQSMRLWNETRAPRGIEDLAQSSQRAKENAASEEELRHDRDKLKSAAEKFGIGVAFATFTERMERWLATNEQVVAMTAEGGKMLAQQVSNTESVKSFNAMLAALDEYVELQRKRLSEAAASAQSEEADAQRTLLLAMAVVCALAIAAAAWISLSISRGLGRAVGLANAVAAGDLSQTVAAAGNDEIKDLLDALNRMTANLNATAATADAVAEGDLSVRLQRLSDKDRLGIAFERMMENLNATAVVADAIADGDLTIELQRRSNKDRIGKALEAMLTKLRGIVGDAMSAAESVSSGSRQLSASAEKLSEGATEQAASAEEASASMEQMSANVKQNSQNANTTEKIARQSAMDAAVSGVAVGRAVEAMQTIAEKISIVQEIARQTDLLALNAAVEAARAGEHGKGFAVVASEVRKLAERSQAAATEISTLSANTAKAAQEAGGMLAKLVPDIKRTADLVEEITAACREQDVGSSQINQAIQQLDQVTQQNAGASEQVSTTSGQLSEQAERLHATIAFFRVDQKDRVSRDGAEAAVRSPERAGRTAALRTAAAKMAAFDKKRRPATATAKPVRSPHGFALDLQTHGDNLDAEFTRS